MWHAIQRECIYLWYYFDIQFRQIFGYWLLGILIGSFVSVFLKKTIQQWMGKLNGRRLGFLGTICATALGIISPLCMYGTVPIVATLNENGMRQDWIAAFMMSSILMNPQLFFYSLALGTPMAVLRLGVSILGGLLAGLVVYLAFRKTPFYHFATAVSGHDHDTDPNRLLRYLKNVGRNIRITAPYFLLGIALTALYQRYIPEDWINRMFGSDSGFSSLLAAALGVPLYSCGGGTIPLIAAWLVSGMSPGSAVAFMIAGPATKLTNLGALKMALGTRNFFLYILFALLFAAAAGMVVDLFI